MASTASTPWDQDTYQRLDAVRFDGRYLHVRFANGDHATVDPARLTNGQAADWDALSHD